MPGAPILQRPLHDLLLIGAVAAGALLRLWQYAAGASLTVDELAIANSILSRSALELLTAPFPSDQVAPVGFLLLQKGLVTVFGGSEYVLRLYSLAAGTGALVLLALLSSRVVGRRLAWIPTLILAASGPLILHSAVSKPYAGDVFFTLLLLLVALRFLDHPDRREVRFALLAGLVAPWLSLPAVFALGAAAFAVAAAWRRPGGSRGAIGLLPAAWVVSACAALAWVVVLTPDGTRTHMLRYWAGGFLPFPPRDAWELLWPVRALSSLLGDLRLLGVRALALVVVLGAVVLVRRERTVAAIVCLPFLGAGLASALELYPLVGRVAEWSLPVLALLLVAGCQALAGLAARRAPTVSSLLVPALIVAPVIRLAMEPPPFRPDHVRPLFDHFAAEARPGDVVYVYHGGRQAWQYYAPRAGGEGVKAVIGSCSPGDPALPLREVRDASAHERLWLFAFSHTREGLRERDLIERFLASGGALLVARRDAGATGTLQVYDLRGSRMRDAGSSEGLIAAALAQVPDFAPECWALLLPPRATD